MRSRRCWCGEGAQVLPRLRERRPVQPLGTAGTTLRCSLRGMDKPFPCTALAPPAPTQRPARVTIAVAQNSRLQSEVYGLVANHRHSLRKSPLVVSSCQQAKVQLILIFSYDLLLKMQLVLELMCLIWKRLIF